MEIIILDPVLVLSDEASWGWRCFSRGAAENIQDPSHLQPGQKSPSGINQDFQKVDLVDSSAGLLSSVRRHKFEKKKGRFSPFPRCSSSVGLLNISAWCSTSRFFCRWSVGSADWDKLHPDSAPPGDEQRGICGGSEAGSLPLLLNVHVAPGFMYSGMFPCGFLACDGEAHSWLH